MADIGTAYVQIVPAATGISGQITKQIAPGATQAGTVAGQKVASSMSSKLQSVGGGLMKAGAIATAVSVPIIAGINKAMDAYQVQNEAETKLTEIYKTRIGASDKAAQATMDLASAMQKEGVIGDEVALSGAQQLATFASTTETVDKLIPAMGNLLAQQKGVNATAQDATGIANLFGKALSGQVGALSKVGISFNEAQEEILKTGTEEERAAVLAEVVTQNVGNMNKTLAETPAGKIQQMKNSLGDLAEGIGATLAPVLSDIAQWISANLIPKVEGFISFLQGNPLIANIVVGITGLLAVGGPLLIIIGSIVSAIGALIPVIGAITAPMLIIPGIIAAVVAALVYAWNTSEAFREAVKNLISTIVDSVKPIIPVITGAISQIIGIIGNLISEIANSLVPVIEFLIPIFQKVIKTIVSIAKVAVPILVKAFKLVATIIGTVVRVAVKIVMSMAKTITKAWNGIKSIAKPVWEAIKSAVTTPIKAIKGIIGPVIDTIKRLMSFKGIKDTVSNVFGKIKDVITKPIDTARETIKGIVEKIKGFFKFKVSAPHIPLPHFSIKPAGWKIGDLVKGKIPSLGISWYAEGGIMKEPTLFGGGEAGPEAILPLDPFWKKLDAMQSGGNTFNNTFNIYESDNTDDTANKILKRLQIQMRTA